MKKAVFGALALVILGLSSHAGAVEGGVGTRGGGEVIDVSGRPVLRDLVDNTVCFWSSAQDFVGEKPRLRAALDSLARANWYLAAAIEREIGRLVYCQTRQLRTVSGEDAEGLTIFMEDTNQVAIRLNNTVYVNVDIYRRMDETNQAYLLIHEAMHSYFPMTQSRRNVNLRSTVSSIRAFEEGAMTADQLRFQLRMNELQFPDRAIPLDELRSEMTAFLLGKLEPAPSMELGARIGQIFANVLERVELPGVMREYPNHPWADMLAEAQRRSWGKYLLAEDQARIRDQLLLFREALVQAAGKGELEWFSRVAPFAASEVLREAFDAAVSGRRANIYRRLSETQPWLLEEGARLAQLIQLREGELLNRLHASGFNFNRSSAPSGLTGELCDSERSYPSILSVAIQHFPAFASRLIGDPRVNVNSVGVCEHRNWTRDPLQSSALPPLHEAVRSQRLGLVRQLLRRADLDVNLALPVGGQTALHLSGRVPGAHLYLAELLSHPSIDVNRLDESRDNALMDALGSLEPDSAAWVELMLSERGGRARGLDLVPGSSKPSQIFLLSPLQPVPGAAGWQPSETALRKIAAIARLPGRFTKPLLGYFGRPLEEAREERDQACRSRSSSCEGWKQVVRMFESIERRTD